MTATELNAQAKLDAFTNAYIECMLWSSQDEINGGERLSGKALETVINDCKEFQSKYADLIQESHLGPYQAGHDFWLTRNRHGSGFWDEDIEQSLRDELTAAAHSYEEQSLYIGDDGLIYIF